MIRKAIWLALGVLLFASSSFAQSKADVSFGYSYLRLGGSGGVNLQGGEVSVAGYLNNWFGIAGDFGAYHGSPGGVALNTYTFMGGPRLSAGRNRAISPFVQVLFGGSHLTASAGGISGGGTAFSYSAGGGVDLRLMPHLALRPQVDYLGMHSHGATLNSARASVSLVLRF